MINNRIPDILERLDRFVPAEIRGTIVGVKGPLLRALLPVARTGDEVRIQRKGMESLPAEVIGFGKRETMLAPLGDPIGVGIGDEVMNTCRPGCAPTGDSLLGRVLGPLGEILDDGPPLARSGRRNVLSAPPAAMRRKEVSSPLPLGIRPIDGLLTIGKGQRVGVFAGPGAGKTILLRQAACLAGVDRVVVCLVGERSREVKELIADLKQHGRFDRTVVFASTGDESPRLRLRVCQSALTAAEEMRDRGLDVLLVLDSLTRVARAQRDVGVASGEPTTRRGYPPSVFTELQRLLERAGTGVQGTITLLTAVLVEGESFASDPVAEEASALLDGHIVLSGLLASEGLFPAVDPAASLSRVMARIVNADHLQAATRFKRLWAAYERNRELITLGAYQKGSDQDTDDALANLVAMKRFIRQSPDERAEIGKTASRLVREFGSG